MYIAKGNLSLKCLLNDFNNIVSSNNFECNGVSFVSKEEADKNCVKNFNEKFKNMKLNDIINFNNKVF